MSNNFDVISFVDKHGSVPRLGGHLLGRKMGLVLGFEVTFIRFISSSSNGVLVHGLTGLTDIHGLHRSMRFTSLDKSYLR